MAIHVTMMATNGFSCCARSFLMIALPWPIQACQADACCTHDIAATSVYAWLVGAAGDGTEGRISCNLQGERIKHLPFLRIARLPSPTLHSLLDPRIRELALGESRQRLVC
jgi:hypothetical protein